MKFIKSKKALVLLAVTVVAVVAAVAGYAYWTASGSGAGSAQTGSISNGIQVHQTSAPSGLYPNGPAGALSEDFGNTNDSAAYVSSVTVALDRVTMAGPDGAAPFPDEPDCTTADFALSATSDGSATDNGDGTFTVNVGQEIAGQAGQSGNPYDGSWSGVSVGLVDNLSANQDNCKDATINLAYTSN